MKLVRNFLIFVGKPFYKLLTFFVIAILSALYFLGHLLLSIPVKKFKFPSLKIKLIFIKFIHLIPHKKLRLKIKVKAVILFLPFILLTFAFYFFILRGIPSPYELVTKHQDVSTKIYDRNGVLLYKIYKNQNRTPIPLSQIPLHVRMAALAAEDAEFYSHPGFSIKGILRALVRNIQTGELSGGSTITQQLVKDVLLSPQRTIIRKIKEITLAIEVEHKYTKDQILEMYLNEVPFGGTAYGIKEGAEEYFNKDVGDLSLAEAAYLTGLIKSPTQLSPFGSNPDLALEREKEVLHLLRINKFITPEQEGDALNEQIVIKPGNRDIKAPHFVMYVREELVNKYGEDMVEKGGLEVTTTLDYQIQEVAEKIVKDEVDKLKGLNVGNGAAIVLNPQDGEILAMVGSKDYFDPNGGNVNVTLRLRQPGSSIKIVNYAYALSHGYTPATILDDSPTTFKVAGLPAYTPVNYDGQFRGKISLRSALAQSRNVPAVKVLASYGVAKMIDLGNKMGITSWQDPSQYGLSLTLGGGDVKLIDLARAYATIANFGKRPNLESILQVKDYKGNILEEDACQTADLEKGINVSAEEKSSKCDTPQVVDPRVAYQLIDILKDNAARAPEFGTNSYLVVPNHPEVAAKTGTSNNLKDNLTLGFNQNYLVAVWVGNNDSSPMSRIASGVTGAAPIWNKIMSSLLVNKQSQAWIIPQDMVTKDCFGKNEYFLKENVPNCTSPSPQPTGKPQILEPAAKTEVTLP